MNALFKKRPLPLAILVTLAGMVCGAHCLYAAGKSYDIDLKEIGQAPYDINLKELRKTPPRRTKTHHKHVRKAAQDATSIPSNAPKNSSVYTVQPGDFPFLILTRHYGLSQAAAEQLIPEVMRLNNLRSPRELTVGQRLIIPVPVAPAAQASSKERAVAMPPAAPASSPSAQPRDATPTAVQSSDAQPPTVQQPAMPAPVIQLPAGQPPVVQPPVVQPPVIPPPASQTPPVQPSTAKGAPVREIQLLSAPPCQLTGEIAKLLGMRIPDISALFQTGSASLSYKNRKLVVVCGLTEAETYTSQKILARHGAQLLLFDGDEPPREVIEELADSLGMPFQPANEDAGTGLPATYTLSGADSSGRDVRLTILPAPVPDKKASP